MSIRLLKESSSDEKNVFTSSLLVIAENLTSKNVTYTEFLKLQFRFFNKLGYFLPLPIQCLKAETDADSVAWGHFEETNRSGWVPQVQDLELLDAVWKPPKS